jgi:hypothetical protein
MKHLSIVNVELQLKAYWASITAETLYRKINISIMENFISNRRVPLLSLQRAGTSIEFVLP